MPLEIRTLASMALEPMAEFTWDDVDTTRELPIELFRPPMGVIVTANKQIWVDRQGNPHVMEDRTIRAEAADGRAAYLVQISTGEYWQVLTHDGFAARVEWAGSLDVGEVDSSIAAGDSIFLDLATDHDMSDEEIAEVERMIGATQAAVRRGEGPPRWARRQASGAIDRAAARRAGDDRSSGSEGGADDGRGSGTEGSGTGGGGDAERGHGTADAGDGSGSGESGSGRGEEDRTGDGDGRDGGQTGGSDARPPAPGEDPGRGSGETASDRTQAGSGRTAPTGGERGGTGSGGDGADGLPMSVPMTEEQRRQRVRMRLTMTPDGYPAVSVEVDGARALVPMREGETDASLDERLAAAERELAESRDPNLSTRVEAGAAPGEVDTRATPTATQGQAASADQANAATGGSGGAPGERVPGGSGIANAPAWPAQLELYGVDTSNAVTVVTGATNQAAMQLNRGSDVFDYFQRIAYTWELIDVTDMQVEDRGRASESTGVGAGDVVNRGEGQLRDLMREQSYIAEDIAAEHWAVRAAAFQLIGLSAGIRTLGNLISSFVSLLSEPMNEREIPWGTPGEYIVRCVATPVTSEDARADPDRHVIRASSVKCLPVRVVDVNARATEVNDQEQTRLADLERQLEEAEARDPDSQLAVDLRAEIAELRRRTGLGAVARIRQTLDDVEQEIRFCEILVEERASALEIEHKDDLMERRELSDEEYGDLHEYRVGLLWQHIRPEQRLAQLRASSTALTGRHRQAQTWRRELKDETRDYRPNVTLVSEANGQVYQMLTMLGEDRDSRDGDHHWVFYDMTSDKTQRRYHGRSSKSGRAGRNEAIRNAFVDFRENAEYGRGTIAIRMPDELADVGVESRMRAAPGATARWMQRLSDLATAAEIAALVVGVVATGGAAAAVIGGMGALAGSAVAAHRMYNRWEGDRLDLDYETFMDVLSIVGAVVAVMPAVTGIVGAVARRGAQLARESGDVGAVLRRARWVQRAEMVDRGLHVFGLVQGIGQTVIQIPYDIIRQFQELEEGAGDMSPGELRARRAMILLNGIRSGAIGVVGLAQSIGEPMPHVTSDAEIWSQASEAAGVTPGATVDGAPAPATVTGDGDVSADRGGHRLEVEPPDISGAEADPRAGPGEGDVHPVVEPDSDAESATTDPDGPADAPAVAGAAPSGPPATRSLSADRLLREVRRILFADRGALPPTDRIVIIDAATFGAATGHGPETLAAIDPSSGRLRINADVLDATPGIAAGLEAIVAARGHPTGRRSLGDLLGATVLRQMIRNVFGSHPGVPAGADHPTGRQLFIELARVIGSSPIFDAYFHGDIGGVRDRLRERLGAGRTDAILDAARTGALGEMIRLLAPDSGALTGVFGDSFASVLGEAATAQGDASHGRGATDAQRLATELAEVVGRQPLRDAHFGGDVAAMSLRLRDVLGGDAAVDAFTDQVRSGDLATARRTLAEARSGPIPVPAEASGAASRFNESLSGPPEASQQAASDLLRDLRSFEVARRLIESGSLGGSALVEAARARLQATREALVDAVVAQVKQSIEARFEGILVVKQDLGTVGFASDRDVTLRAESAAADAPRPTAELIRASTEAVRDAYDLLRQQRLDPASALDTNFYTELHEGAIAPASAAERVAISGDQTIVSLTEIELSAPGSLADLQRAQLETVASSDVPDAVRAEMRQRIEQQFATALRRAAELSSGSREGALQRARRRLEDALQRTPPPSARELRQLMADVKLLEPDAYGSRAAVEGVVYGQQGMRRAETNAARREVGRHIGGVDRSAGTLTEQLEHRLQQARSAFGHLLAHVRPDGGHTVRDVRDVAKQLSRILHAFREAGQMIDHPLLDDAGSVVASKSENDPEATIREVRVWAERTGTRFGSDQAMIDAYVVESRRLGMEMTTRLGANTEATRSFEPLPGDVPTPASDPGGASASPADPAAELTADRPVDGRDVDRVDADGAAAARSDGATLRPHEVAHEQLLDRLRASMHEPIPAPDGPTRPVATGEVGRSSDPAAAYDMFRDAVARAGGREVGLFFDRASGTYAVMVGREASVAPPSRGGPWECPIHTHPNPENVLVYRMPAPNDVLQYWQTALRTGRRASAFIEYPLPEGGRGTCRLEIDPNGNITFEYPGQIAPETLTIREYQERWDDRTRYVEPGSPEHARFLQDMVDRSRAIADGYSSAGPMPDDIPAYAFEFASTELRARIEAASPHPDTHELHQLLEEAEAFRDMDETDDAQRVLDEVARRVRLIEPESRPTADTGLEDASSTTPIAPTSAGPGAPPNAPTPAFAARLADLQTDLRRMARRTEGTEGAEVWRLGLLDTADQLSTMHPSEATDRMLADLRAESSALDEALTQRNQPVQRNWVASLTGRLHTRLSELNGQLASLRRSLTRGRTGAARADATRERIEQLEAQRVDVQAMIADADRLGTRLDEAAATGEVARFADSYRQLRDQEAALDRVDGDVVLDLSDPITRRDVEAFFRERAADLTASGEIGELLYSKMMEHLASTDQLVLAQSPRSSGAGAMDTADLRAAFIDDQLPQLPGWYQRAFYDAARGTPDGWPRTSAGHAWEVDHVQELWAGGADAGHNLLALPPALHRQLGGGLDPTKTGMLTGFRRRFRDRLRVRDEQVSGASAR